MEENTSTLDIRAINEKIERKCIYRPSYNGNGDCGQKHMVERLLIDY
jgi:MoxR-like ATPase